MNSKHLHTIIQEIGANLDCKQCKSKLSINNLKLTGQSNNIAYFEVLCPNCSSVMKITAETKKQELINQSGITPVNISKTDSIINQTEINSVKNILTKISSFKDVFGVFLILCFVMFSGCTSDTNVDQAREDILKTIEDAKVIGEDVVKQGKDVYSGAVKLIEEAPEKIEEIKNETEQIIKEAKELKDDAAKTLEQTKDAINKINEASQAAKDAIDAVEGIGKEKVDE